MFLVFLPCSPRSSCVAVLSGPLDRLNAILSLLQPLDRYRAPSAIGSAIGRPLSRPISLPCTGRSSQPPRSKPLRGAQPRDSGAIVSQTLRSEKLHNESSPNFSNFRPEFSPEFSSEFSPNFPRRFRASFRGKRRPKKNHQKSPPFFNANFPCKHEKNIHKIFLESRQRDKPL